MAARPRLQVAPPIGLLHLLQGFPTGQRGLHPHLAAVHVRWPEICARRGHLDEDVLAYAMAWCRYRDGEVSTLAPALQRLRTSRAPGVSAAAVEDLVNVIADSSHGDEAVAGLESLDLPVHELLASVYADLDRPDDARAVLARMPLADDRTAVCEQQLAQVLVRFDIGATKQLWSMAETSPCASYVRGMLCDARATLPKDKTLPRFDRLGCQSVPAISASPEQWIIRAYLQWELASASGNWLHLVDLLAHAMPLPGAEHAAIVALTNLATECWLEPREPIRAWVATLRARPDHDSQLDPELDALAALTTSCVPTGRLIDHEHAYPGVTVVAQDSTGGGREAELQAAAVIGLRKSALAGDYHVQLTVDLTKLELKAGAIRCAIQIAMETRSLDPVSGNGSAVVSYGGAAADQALAVRDCIEAVVGDLIFRKLSPRLKK